MKKAKYYLFKFILVIFMISLSFLTTGKFISNVQVVKADEALSSMNVKVSKSAHQREEYNDPEHGLFSTADEPQICVGNDSIGNCIAVMQFNIPSGVNIESAELKLSVPDNWYVGSPILNILSYPCDDYSWRNPYTGKEDSYPTHNNVLLTRSIGKPIVSLQNKPVSKGINTFDMTDYVKLQYSAGHNIGIILAGSGTYSSDLFGFTYSDSDSSKIPQLAIKFTTKKAQELTGGLSFNDPTGLSNNGKTKITLGNHSTNGVEFKYKISADDSAVPIPNLGDDVSSWTSVSNGDLIAAAAGKHIAVADVDAWGEVMQFSDGIAVVQDEVQAPSLATTMSFSDVAGYDNNNKTKITLGNPSVIGNTFRYIVSSDNNPLPDVSIGQDAASWTSVQSGDNIPATNGKYIGVAEVDSNNKIVQFSNGTAVVVNEVLAPELSGAFCRDIAGRENNDKTQINLPGLSTEGKAFKYKIYSDGDNTQVVVGEDVSSWTTVTNGQMITAQPWDSIEVAEVDSSNKVLKFSCLGAVVENEAFPLSSGLRFTDPTGIENNGKTQIHLGAPSVSGNSYVYIIPSEYGMTYPVLMDNYIIGATPVHDGDMIQVANGTLIGVAEIYTYDNWYYNIVQYSEATAVVVDETLAPVLSGGVNFSDPSGVSNNGKTQINLGNPSVLGNTFRYKISSDDNPVATPSVGNDVSSWLPVVSGDKIATINGKYIGVAEVDSSNKVVQFSNGTAVIVNDSDLQASNSTFDKNINSVDHRDAEILTALNGNTLTNINNGTAPLIKGTNYTTGSSITIKKEYLSTLPLGTTNLTFKFSSGADKVLAITVVDTTPIPINNLTATAGDGQVTLNFTAPIGSVGVLVQQSADGAGFVAATTTSAITGTSTSAVVTGLSNGTTYSFRLVVTGGSHAGISNVTTATPIAVVVPPPTPEVTEAPSEANIVIVNNAEGAKDVITVTGLIAGDVVRVYNSSTGGSIIGAGTVAAGQTSVTINVPQLGLNAGNVYVSVTRVGKTESSRTMKAYAQEIRNSSLNVSSATFDKNTSKQVDLSINVTFNGNTLTNIKNGATTLVNGTDYEVSGNVIIIKKSYLASQSLGSAVLTFTFSGGNSQAMTVNIVDTTVTVPDNDNNDDKATGVVSTSGGSGTTTTGTTETRTVDVVAGTGANSTAASVKVEITRTVTAGTKVDAIKLDETKITETIGKAVATNKDTVTVLVTDLKDNPADEVDVQVPKASIDKLVVSGIGLKIDSPKAKLQIPDETLKSVAGDIKITMKEVTDASKINDTKALVLKTVGDSSIVGNPVEVETNFSGRTEITIPLKTENLPKDPAELKKVLDSLAVQIHHSDGENATEKGNPIGISIWVDKFSTFTVVALSKDGMDKLTANNGLISDRAAQNGNSKGNASDKNSESSQQNSKLPEIKFVGLGHSPLVEGDKEDFIISSGFDGNVQYRIYLNVDGVWQEVTNGYSVAVSGQDTFAITPDYTFAKGQYQGRVYVKKAGIAGSKQEDGIDFDNYYTYNINCVDRDDANRVYTAGALEIASSNNTDKVTDNKAKESTNTAGNSNTSSATESNNSFKTGQKITITGIDGISGIPGPYYYRLSIYDAANDKWTNNVVPYSENLEWTPTIAGTYVLDVHVITPNSVLWDNIQKDPTLIYGGYEGWKLKDIKVNN